MEKATFNWFPGHMNKTLKSIATKLPAVDLVIEIVDARAPQSSANRTLHRLMGAKPLLTLLSKADWADPQVTKQWLSWYLKQNRSAAILDYQDRHFSQKLVRQINDLLAPKRAKWKTKGVLNPQINVLVIGVPNVGKSTFINHLLKRHKAITANRPGVTRGLQIIQLSPQINLIDSPGVLPARLGDWQTAINLAAINSIKSEIYPVWEVGSSLVELLYVQYPEQFHRYYRLEPSLLNAKDAADLFKAIAQTKYPKIDDQFNWEKKIVSPFIADLANGKLKISFERPI